MKEDKRPYLWILGGVIVFLIVAVVANREENVPGQSRLPPDTANLEPLPLDEARESKPQKKTTTSSKASEYSKRYAGVYEILVDNFHSPGVHEKLFLYPDGACTWHWVQDGRLQSTKDGIWTARRGYIETLVKGITGDDIPEDFTFSNGAFRSGHRYLKRLEKL